MKKNIILVAFLLFVMVLAPVTRVMAKEDDTIQTETETETTEDDKELLAPTPPKADADDYLAPVSHSDIMDVDETAWYDADKTEKDEDDKEVISLTKRELKQIIREEMNSVMIEKESREYYSKQKNEGEGATIIIAILFGVIVGIYISCIYRSYFSKKD